MNVANIIISALVAIAFIAAFVKVIRRRKTSGGGCEYCHDTSCPFHGSNTDSNKNCGKTRKRPMPGKKQSGRA